MRRQRTIDGSRRTRGISLACLLAGAGLCVGPAACSPVAGVNTGNDGDDGGEGGGGGGGGGAGVTLWTTYVQCDGDIEQVATNGQENPVVDSSTGAPLAAVVSVQDGLSHGCAALSDGTVECWPISGGGNSCGQLGNGTTIANPALYRSTPVLTAPDEPLSNVALVANGQSNAACAVTNDNKVYCWGDLTWLLNDGKTLCSPYAQLITTDGSTPFTGVEQLAVGAAQACALVGGGSTNEVWCWGKNNSEELGQGDTMPRQYPTRVLGLTSPSWVVIAQNGCCDTTVCAEDGENVRCWGSNVSGAAGANSNTGTIQAPTLVVDQSGSVIDGVVDVEPGYSAFSILRSDGTMWNWGWGANDYAVNYNVPNIAAIGWAGGGGSAARYLTSDGTYHGDMAVISISCN
jgi:alpha-tubulin suppressor-like RCC1 family protein